LKIGAGSDFSPGDNTEREPGESPGGSGKAGAGALTQPGFAWSTGANPLLCLFPMFIVQDTGPFAGMRNAAGVPNHAGGENGSKVPRIRGSQFMRAGKLDKQNGQEWPIFSGMRGEEGRQRRRAGFPGPGTLRWEGANIQHRTSNIQHPTSNIQWPSLGQSLGVGCWMLDVSPQFMDSRHEGFFRRKDKRVGFERAGGASVSLAYHWRTASQYLVGTYWVPSEYLSDTYPTPSDHAADA
jgi:hypothetical protein